MDRAARGNYDSEGFHAHLYLSGGSPQPPRPKQWEAAYHSPKLADVLIKKSRWKKARVIVRTVTLPSAPKQLKLDFGTPAGEEVSGHPHALTHLEVAATRGDEAAFINALKGIGWGDRPASEFTRAIKLALKAGAYLAARELSEEAIRQHPDNGELREYARMMSPPKVVSKDLPFKPSFQANREWLNKHAHEYSGKWIAIRNGELLGAADSFDELFERIGRSKEVLFTRA